MKTKLKTALFAAATLFCTQLFAADENNTVPGLTAAGSPLGLHGVDPVAFIQLENRIQGTAAFTSVHDGVAYYFASEGTQKTFEQSPDRYVPQNGGFCTYGVSVGKKFDGNPQYGAVVGGKLYVFLNEDIYRAFDADRKGTIKKAEVNWKRIRTVAATDL